MHAQRILFFPLGNVLGHLTRTLALAEEFAAQGHEVHLALDQSYPSLAGALPASIRVHPTPELDASATRSFGPIAHYDESEAGDRTNLERAQQIDRAELRRRGARLGEMVRRDGAIVAEVSPDAVITDYRFTIELLQQGRPRHVFHISHLLGYPSLYQRLRGRRFFPLDSAPLLVPGIASIEHATSAASPASSRSGSRSGSRSAETLCGPFRWRGWQRLSTDRSAPPASDVFLCFGSTGQAEQIVPWLLQAIPGRYRISAIAPADVRGARRGVHLERQGALERFLPTADVAFCHGGHGTVMECILHRTPMAIFPQNIEQLEIGRAVEALGLGVLVKAPYPRLSGAQLGALIERLRTDARMAHELARLSALLQSQDGPKQALATVLAALEGGARDSS